MPDIQDAEKKEPTLWSAYIDEVNAFGEEQGFEGFMLIRGAVPDGEDDEDEDEQNEDGKTAESKITADQIKNARVIMATTVRKEALELWTKHLLGEQYGDCMMMFNTSFSYEVLDVIDDFNRQYAKWPAHTRFDMLFGLTFALERYDTWMHDHEIGWDGFKSIKGLGQKWKALLKRSDEELHIDGKYTRPGIVAMLENFNKELQGTESAEEFVFRFQ